MCIVFLSSLARSTGYHTDDPREAATIADSDAPMVIDALIIMSVSS
jgi:hypothetical protein